MAISVLKDAPPEEAKDFDHLDEAERARLAAVQALKVRLAVDEEAAEARRRAHEALQAHLAAEEAAERARLTAEEAEAVRLADEAETERAKIAAEEAIEIWRTQLAAEGAKAALTREPEPQESREDVPTLPPFSEAELRAAGLRVNDNSAAEAGDAEAAAMPDVDPSESQERAPALEAEPRADGLSVNGNSAPEAEDVEVAAIRNPDPPESEERAPALSASSEAPLQETPQELGVDPEVEVPARMASPTPSPAADLQETPQALEPDPEEIPAAVAPDPTCQVAYWRGYRKAAFYARAFDEEGLEVALAESPLFKARGNGVPERTEQAVAAYDALLAQLAKDGWEPIGGTDNWFGQTLRRSVSTAPE